MLSRLKKLLQKQSFLHGFVTSNLRFKARPCEALAQPGRFGRPTKAVHHKWCWINKCHGVQMDRWKKKGWDELAKCLQDFVLSKYRELEMAVLGIGERKLDQQYKHLQMTAVQWRSMSKQEHKEVLQQAHLTPELDTELSIGPDESSVCGFTSDQLQDVWHKAGLILQSPENIVSAPNNPKITVCFSETSNFTVTQWQNLSVSVKRHPPPARSLRSLALAPHWQIQAAPLSLPLLRGRRAMPPLKGE